MKEHPAVDLHLDSPHRRVDVIAEGFDVAIRVRVPPFEPTDLVMRKLDESTQRVVASPALVPRALRSPTGLSALPSLDQARADRDHVFRLERAGGETAVVAHKPRLVTDDMAALREAALAGVGVVQLLTVMIYADITAGRLIHILPQWRPKTGIVHAVFPSRRGLLPSVRALLDFLAKECATARLASDRVTGGGDR